MAALNIWNNAALRGWLSGIADGDERTAELLLFALEKPLRAHASALIPLETLPPDAPGWLKRKFGTAVFHTFDPALDPGLPEKIRHIRDWIAGAAASDEAWTKDKKPQRLSHFKTVEDAVNAADKAMKEEALRLREVFRNNPAVLDDENAKTVMTLADGFRIVRLLTPQALDRETAAMGHCIGNGGYDAKLQDGRHAYYSLRDAMNNPHATMEVKSGTLLQCKGKQNVPPEGKYFPALRAFIEREKFLLAENHSHTGLWQAPDGTYHSIRRLPKGAQIRGNLDLSSLRDVVLPENLSVSEDLFLSAAASPALPEVLKAGRVIWRKNGKVHREGGPASIWYDPETGDVVEERWFKTGLFHRDDGPALIKRDPKTGAIIQEVWYRDGQIHRDDGPAWIARDPETGVIIEERWYRDGRLHRDDGPAWIKRDPKAGEITKETWFRDGQGIVPPAAEPVKERHPRLRP